MTTEEEQYYERAEKGEVVEVRNPGQPLVVYVKIEDVVRKMELSVDDIMFMLYMCGRTWVRAHGRLQRLTTVFDP
jgi:hypothetical protein